MQDWSVYGGNADAMTQACNILGDWDMRHTVDSVGGHVFYEFWREASRLDNLWAVPFSAVDPVNTPNTLNVTNPEVVDSVLQALVTGVQELQDNGIALDLPWGEVQFIERNGERIRCRAAQVPCCSA